MSAPFDNENGIDRLILVITSEHDHRKTNFTFNTTSEGIYSFPVTAGTTYKAEVFGGGFDELRTRTPCTMHFSTRESILFHFEVVFHMNEYTILLVNLAQLSLIELYIEVNSFSHSIPLAFSFFLSHVLSFQRIYQINIIYIQLFTWFESNMGFVRTKNWCL